MIEPDKNAQLDQFDRAMDRTITTMFSMVQANPTRAQDIKRQMDKLNKIRYLVHRFVESL